MTEKAMTYRECYERGVAALQKAEVPEAELDARLLLEYVCSTNRNTLLVHGDMPLTAEKAAAYEALLEKRGRRIPLQQITGEQEFCGLSFFVNEHVLIPRQDTEILVEAVLKQLKSGMSVLDMCTGSGCILISLISLSEGIKGAGADISEQALFVAKQNGRRLLSEEKQPEWFLGDLFAALSDEKSTEKFDVIVSNPPYIKSAVVEELMPEVREHEPKTALDGREDGLFFYREIIKESKAWLKKGGRLFFEIGYDQGEALKKMLCEAGFLEVTILKDYAGLDRVAAGKLP